MSGGCGHVTGNGDERCGISACSERERSRELQGLYLCFILISTRSAGLSRCAASPGSWWDSLPSLAPAMRCYIAPG